MRNIMHTVIAMTFLGNLSCNSEQASEMFVFKEDAYRNVVSQEDSLHNATYANIIKIINLNICEEWDVKNSKCKMKHLKLFWMTNDSYLTYFEANSESALCNLGYGDSGCGSVGHMTSPCGTIRSLEQELVLGAGPQQGLNPYPVSLPNSCKWTISVEEGYTIELKFIYFRLRYCSERCLCDRILIIHGTKDSSFSGGQYCGYKKPWSFISYSNTISISYTMNSHTRKVSNQEQYGFVVDYQKIKPQIHIFLQHPIYKTALQDTFSLLTSAPAEMVDGKQSFQWIIRITDETKRIKLNWILDSSCAVVLQIWDGPNSDGRLIYNNSLNGTLDNSSINSTAFQLFVEVVQDIETESNERCNIQFNYTSSDVPVWSDITGENILENWSFVSVNVTQNSTSAINFTHNGNRSSFVGYTFTTTEGEYISVIFKTYQFEGPNQRNCETEGVLLWDGKPENYTKKYGPFCGEYIHSALFRGNQAAIHSSSNVLTLLFYQFEYYTVHTRVDIEVTSTKCRGISDWDTITDIANLNAESTTMENNIKSISLKPNAEVCFRIQSFPVFSEGTSNFKLVLSLNKSQNAVTDLVQSRLIFCNSGFDGGGDYYMFIIADSGRNCGFFVTVRTEAKKERSKKIKEECQPISLRVTNKSDYRVEVPEAICGKITFQYSHKNRVRIIGPKDLGGNYYYKLKFMVPPDEGLTPIEIDMWESSETEVMRDPELNIIEYPFVWHTSWSSEIDLEIEFKYSRPTFPLVLEYKLEELKYPKPEQLKGPKCQNSSSDETFQYNGHCYRVVRTKFGAPSSWMEAQADCEKWGGDLVSINTEEELLFIKGIIRDHYIKSLFRHENVFYIGLVRDSKEYRWSTGDPVTITDWYQRNTAKTQIFPQELFGTNVNFAFPTVSQPIDNTATRCSAMVISTPMMPTNWIMMPCHYPYDKGNYICKKTLEIPEPDTLMDEKLTHKVTFSNQTILYPGKVKCKDGWNFFNNDTCLKMITSMSQISRSLSCSDADYICSEHQSHLAHFDNNSFTGLLHLLKAWRYVPKYGGIWFGECQGIHWEETIMDIAELKLNMFSEDLTGKLMLNVLCEMSPEKTIHSCGKLQFACNEGTCFADHHRCDGVPDCPDSEDEQGCTCEETDFQCQNGACISMSKYCDFVPDCFDKSDETNCTFSLCPDGYKACRNGQCVQAAKFDDKVDDCLDASDEDVDPQDSCPFFRCYSGKCLPEDFIHNGRIDCGITMEDEIFYQRDVERGSWMGILPDGVYMVKMHNTAPFCPKGNGFHSRCRPDHLNCFPRDKACIYERDKYGYMGHCTDGSHLRHCEHFECPNMFKCPNSYCVPYSKICDGITDCIGGADEKECGNLTCPGLFKCRKEGICIDQSSVCDGVVDCTISHDDELSCDFLECPKNCECQGRTISCTDSAYTIMPHFSFHSRYISLFNNSIKFTNDTRMFYPYLGKLILRSNQIGTIPEGLFKHLTNLLKLDLRNNQLTSVEKGMFYGLHSLQHLYLQENPLRRIGTQSFLGLNSMTNLLLTETGITMLDVLAFSGMKSLISLSLNNNSLTWINSSMFQDLSTLKTLDLQENPIQNYEVDTLNALTLTELHTDEFKFCCYAKNVEICTPEGDAFSTCEDLLANLILRAAIWTLGIGALVGNFCVIIWRLFTQGKKPGSFLIVNLAISDMLMGIYLIIIAATDLELQGKYILFADEWKESILCKTAGVISTLSSQMSVYMMLVITADRFISIVFPFSVKKISFKKAVLLSLVGWVVFTILSIIPVLGLPYFGNNFIKNGVCLLFNITAGQSSGWEYVTFLFLSFNLVVFLFIFFAYIAMYLSLERSRLNCKRQATEADKALAKKFFVIVLTDFLCWFPIILTSYLSIGGVPVHPQVSVWLVVFILPLNSFLNPFLYTLTSIWQMRKRNLLKKKNNQNQVVTQLSRISSK